MLSTWSRFEQAWRDTLVHKAEGAAFTTLARAYGVARPEQEASEYAWRGVLHAMGLGRRVSLAAAYWAVEAALSDANETYTGQATVDPYKTDIYVPGGGKLSGFDPVWGNRLWRSQYGLLWSERVTTDQVIFSPYSTTYWDACPVLANGLSFELQLLPFVLRERTPGEINATGETSPGLGCQVDVELYNPTIARYAATYMRMAPTKRHITADDTGTDTITVNGLHGLTPGNRVLVFSRYGSVMTTTGYDGTVHHGTDHVPGGLTDYTQYYVKTTPTTTSLTLSTTNGGAVVNLTSGQTGTVYIVRFDDLINDADYASGHLLPSELTDSNVAESHPNSHPAYLFDGSMFPRVRDALDGCLAAGVRLVMGWYPMNERLGLGTPDWHLIDPSPGL